MGLIASISEDLKVAMKERNTAKLSVLRVLKSEIQRCEQTSNGKIALADADVVKLIKKLIDSIKETSNNQDEINALSVYLPKQLTRDEIMGIITLMGSKNLGEIMKGFKANYDGLYDGKVLSNIVKEIFV